MSDGQPEDDATGTVPARDTVARHATDGAGSAEQLELLNLAHVPTGRGRNPQREDQAGGKARSGRNGHDHTPAYLAQENPVARVIVESHVPHLDRTFDYAVPKDLAAKALPGTRVRVRFGGQQLQAWVIERSEHSEVGRERLQPILRVLSELPVLTEDILAVARLVAARSAGVLSDVLRAAVPPRVATVEKQAMKAAPSPAVQGAQTPEDEPDEEPGPAAHVETAMTVDTSAWELYQNGSSTIRALAGNHEPDSHEGEDPQSASPVRVVLQGLPSHPDHTLLDLVAQAVAVTYARGRGVVVVVGDAKTLERLQTAVEARVPPDAVARLHSEDKPTPRYRAFLQVLTGERTVVLGTRPAVWAPVKDPGLVVVVDDGDPNLIEQRAPYHHARDVALVRSEHQAVPLVIASHGVTPEAQRLVDTGWATAVSPDRATLRAFMPRIVATADSWHSQRDSLAGRARLPETAFRIAREALANGPVLVQVARAGYAPSLACQRCRTPVRCTVCDGPLTVSKWGDRPSCGWCARAALAWSCSVCGDTRWRMSAVGSQRTAEELGRAFPQVPVIASSGDKVRRRIEPEPALVVATPGGEPWVEGRYAAALLLDGDRMLARTGLRAEEETLRRWFEAASLVRSGDRGGTVVVTSEHEHAVNTLVRWDPAEHALRELAERRTLQLPPAVRSAALTGQHAALEDFLRMANLPAEVRVIGPAPVPGQEGGPGTGEPPGGIGTDHAGLDGALTGDARPGIDHRVLLFFSYGMAAEVTARLRATRAEASALRRFGPVNLRCDVADLL